MKVIFALKNPHLADQIASIISKKDEVVFCYSDTELNKAVQTIGKELDFLFVHESVYESQYPWEWLTALKRKMSDGARMTVILSEQTDSVYREIIMRLSIDLQFGLIPGAITSEELVEQISSRLNPSENAQPVESVGHLAALMSASPKDGATTVAISAAICMAQRAADKKILLIDLNLKSPEIRDHLQIKSDKGYSLIQADCDAGTLDESILIKACDRMKEVSNLYVLTGIQRREWAERIRLEEVNNLLQVARRTFDFVFVDVHTYPDQAATLRSIKDADTRLVVVQPIVTSYQSSWNDWFNSVWHHYGLNEEDFELVLNRDTKGMLEGFQIEKGMGAKIASRIKNVDKGAGIKAINYGIPLYLNPEDETLEFKKDILDLTSHLAGRAGFELQVLPEDTLRSKKTKVRIAAFLSVLR